MPRRGLLLRNRAGAVLQDIGQESGQQDGRGDGSNRDSASEPITVPPEDQQPCAIPDEDADRRHDRGRHGWSAREPTPSSRTSPHASRAKTTSTTASPRQPSGQVYPLTLEHVAG